MSSAVKAHVGPLKLSPPQAKPTLEHRLHSQEHGVDRNALDFCQSKLP